jgi:TolB-like protein/DNA-binding winged helix-turn-helix (wHTH) protein
MLAAAAAKNFTNASFFPYDRPEFWGKDRRGVIGSGPHGILAFGACTLDLARRELCRAGAPVRLEPLAFDLLAYLVRHRDRVISKDELLQELWHGRIVSDSSLTTRLNAVRRAIGDDGKAQGLIRTFSRKGVRFVGTIGDAPARPHAMRRPAGGTPRMGNLGSGDSPDNLPGNDVPSDDLSGNDVPSDDLSGGARSGAASYIAVDRAVVAVADFIAVGGGYDQQLFADGLAEECALALGRFQWFSVLGPIPRDLASPHDLDPRRVARAIGAHYMMHGAVRRDGALVRVTARLIDATTGEQLWSDRFDGDISDGFALQERVALLIAGGIDTPLRSAEARRRNAAPARDATPYDLHLRAYPIFSDGRDSVLRSLRLLEQAIALDPDYAPALADAANCLQILDINCGDLDRQANRAKALGYARRVLERSNETCATTTAAFALTYFNEDSATAAALIDHALKLNPGFARGWYMSGMARLYAGQPEDAVDAFETSMRLDPQDRLGRRNNAGIGLAQLFCHRFDEAIPRLRLMVREFPRWATPYAALAACHAHLGFDSDSISVTGRLKVVDPSLRPNALQFRNPLHRDLLAPGIRLAS